ncbi:hypothetical protein ACA910_018847 [Epithemia clementina (nom. ined.)]
MMVGIMLGLSSSFLWTWQRTVVMPCSRYNAVSDWNNQDAWSVLSYLRRHRRNDKNGSENSLPSNHYSVLVDQNNNNRNDSGNPTTTTTTITEATNERTRIKGWAELYHDAWYIDDEPDWTAFHRIYQDERITELVQQQQLPKKEQGKSASSSSSSASSSPLYQPYQAMDQQTGQHIFFSERPLGMMAHKENDNHDETFLYSPSANHSILTTLRTLDSTKNNFNPVCHRYKFPNITLFPTISVIIPVQHERAGLLSMTVHSFLGRTPPELLHEIIIVDDNGNAEERQGVVDDEEEIENLLQLHPTKIKYIRNERRLGCAGSRMAGIRQATGEVLAVMDSHVEMLSSTWAQHLLLPILENPKTLAVQASDPIDDRTPGYHRKPGGRQNFWGLVNDKFLFVYASERFQDPHNPDDERCKETPSLREPFETPFSLGTVFAMRRDEFWRLGGYDQGLEVWGGENTELAMKVWRCGFDQPNEAAGRVVIVPCSRAGHVFRVHLKETGRWPPKVPRDLAERYGLLRRGDWKLEGGTSDVFARLVARNNLRIFYVWMGMDSEITQNFFHHLFRVRSTDPRDLAPEWRRVLSDIIQDPEIARQISIRDQNNCKSYDWFERHVVYRLVGQYTPLYKEGRNHSSTSLSAVSCGRHSAQDCGSCPQGNGPSWCNGGNNGDCQWCPYAANEDAITAKWTTETKTSKLNNGEISITLEWELSDQSRCVPKSMTCRTRKPEPPNRPPTSEGS